MNEFAKTGRNVSPKVSLGMATSVSGPGPATAAHRSRRSRVVMFGLFGCGNLGNDGSLKAVVEALVRSDAVGDIQCISYDPSIVEADLGLSGIPLNAATEWPRLLRAFDKLLFRLPSQFVDAARSVRLLSSASLMIIPGTGILDDFGEHPTGMPMQILKWCLFARMCGARIAFVSIGAGPIRHPLSRRLMLAAARLAAFRSYRDGPSHRFMKAHGIDVAKDFVYPDVVFGLPYRGVDKRRVPGGRRPPRLEVGLGVMNYGGWYGYAPGGSEIFDRYIRKLLVFVLHLLRAGHRIRLLTGELSDRIAVDALLAEVDRQSPGFSDGIRYQEVRSLEELMRQIGETEIVVATRFHNVVCALKMGRPTISLGYAEKNDVLMADMGLGDFCQHVETFDVDVLITQFDRLVAERDAIAPRIVERRSEYERQLADQADSLVRLID